MKVLKSALCGAVAATMALGVMVGTPASAAPLPNSEVPAISDNVVDVGSRREYRREMRRDRREARRDRRENRREARRDRREDRREARRDRRRHFEHRGGYAYLRGHRGSRHHRHGWRHYHGWWFPPAAFAGVIIGGAVASANNSAHVQWCYDRYRSYREWDNTFQPYNGPRRQCISPYS